MVGKTRPVTEHLAATEHLLAKSGETVRDIDPYSINARLENQTSRLLRLMEEMPDESIEIKAFYMSLIAIWRMRAVGVALRKEKPDEPNRGSAVRKYTATFAKAHDAGGRKKGARSAERISEPEPAPEPDIESILNGDADDDLA